MLFITFGLADCDVASPLAGKLMAGGNKLGGGASLEATGWRNVMDREERVVRARCATTRARSQSPLSPGAPWERSSTRATNRRW